MDAKGEFEEFLVKKGLRHTSQRQQILRVFLATEHHVTVEQLCNLVKVKYKGIGYATVARTMKLLSECGVCREVDFGDGTRRFEHKYGHEHHDHLICLACGKFEEIYSLKLERIQDVLVKKYGYVQEKHKLDIFGFCPKCAKKHIKKKLRGS